MKDKKKNYFSGWERDKRGKKKIFTVVFKKGTGRDFLGSQEKLVVFKELKYNKGAQSS